MEALDQTLIEQYWANEMSSTERQNFEQRLALESGLQQEFDEFKLAMEAVKLAERKELLQRFRQRDEILDKKNRNNPSGRTMRIWMQRAVAVAAVLTLFLGWRFFISPMHTPDLANTHPTKDSIDTRQTPPFNTETSQVVKLKDDKVKEENEKVKEQKPSKPKVKEEVLYAAYFETFKDDSMDPTSRSGEDDLSAYEKFQLFYWEEKNAEALEEFKKMTLPQQINPNLRFFQANALMAVNRIDEAINILAEVEKNQQSIYKIESVYYLALCDIKNGNLDAARKKLLNYLNTQEALQKNKAQKILAELN